MVYACGIDFGTTNSAIAVTDGKSLPKLVPLKNEKSTTPTAMFYPVGKSSLPLFGEDAVQAFITGESGRFMRSMKRVLGSDLMLTGTLVNNRIVSFKSILSQFISHLKIQAEKYCQHTIENVVLGRPVHFRENDEQGDKRAEQELFEIAHQVGFKHIAFQYEPIAAAYAHEINVKQEQLACVIDIGGGTSDFSIIKIGKTSHQKSDRTNDILACTGVRVGGNDFDSNLSLKFFMPEFGYNTLKHDEFIPEKLITIPSKPYCMMSNWSDINQMYSKKIIEQIKKTVYSAVEPEKINRFVKLLEQEEGHALLNVVEKAKMDLTTKANIHVQLKFMPDFPQLNIQREQFESVIENNLNKIIHSVNECVLNAQIQHKDIQMIILTGGSTEIPIIQRKIKELFPYATISQRNKLSSVGLGLAFDCLNRFE